MTVAEIESAITRLPAKELIELVKWFQEHHAQVWDEQIEQDLDSGRLDNLLGEVEKEYQAGLARPL